MDDVNDQKKKSRAQRKRKLEPFFDVNDEYASDSSEYVPPKDHQSDSSDDSTFEIKKKTSRCKKKKLDHDTAQLETKRKKLCRSSKGLEGNNSDDCSQVEEGLDKQVAGKKDSNGAKQKVGRKSSRGRGRPPLQKETKTKEQKKKKGRRKIRESKLQQIQKKSSTKPPRLGRFAVIGHWYVASGVTKDLTALFEAFDDQEGWRFSDFSKCWVELKFSLIYRGRYSSKELVEFTEELILWTKKFLSPHHAMKWRVGALYALYGLYHKHPLRHFFKIRIEMEEYENLVNLARSFQSSAENPDPAYTFYKLKAEGVFHFVALTEEMGLNFCTERQKDIMNYEMQWILREHSAKSIFPERDHNIQKTLMREYEMVKSQLGDEKEPNLRMSYVQSSILSEVDDVLAGLQEDSHQQPLTHTQTSTDQTHVDSDEVSNKVQRKREILLKAAALSTTEEFLQRKQLRSPRKKPTQETTQQDDELPGSSGYCNADNQNSTIDDIFGVHNGIDKVANFRKIMELMEPPEEGDLDSSPSPRKIKGKSLQKQLKKDLCYSELDGLCDSDSPSIVFPNEWQRNDELGSSENEDDARVLLIKGKNNTSLQAIVTRKKTLPEEDKTGTSVQKQKKKRGKPRKSNLKNNIKCKPLEKSQVTETNEILGSKNMLEEIYETSESDTHSDLLANERAKKLNGKVLKNKFSSVDGEECSSEKTHRQLNSLCDSKDLKKSIALSQGCEETFSLDGADIEGSGHAVNHASCSSEDAPENITGRNTSLECLHDEAVTNEALHNRCSNDKIMSRFQSEQNNEPDSYVDEMQTSPSEQSTTIPDSHVNGMESEVPLPQENCSGMNIIKKVLDVKLLSGTHQARARRSSLKPTRMICVEVNFHEGESMVHSAKFKILRKDLEVLQNNESKLKSLKQKLHSFLPAHYENYELNIQLPVLQSVNKLSEKEKADVSEPLVDKHSNKHSSENYEKQDSKLSLKKFLNQELEILSEKQPEQGHESAPVLPLPSDVLVKREEPLTSITQKEKDSSYTTKGDHNISSSSHGTCNATSLGEEILEAELFAFIPKKKSHKLSKARDTAHVNVYFRAGGLTIHHMKYKISMKDLKTLQNNKAKLEGLKRKFYSFLPPKYQKHEMRLLLTAPQLDGHGNEIPVQHSKQDSNPVILHEAPATPLDAKSTDHAEPSPFASQENLPNICSTNEGHNLPSKSPIPYIQHNVPNTRKMEIYNPSHARHLSQYYVSNTAKPVYIKSELLHPDSTHESCVDLINEGAHCSESFSSRSSDREGNAYVSLSNIEISSPKVFQMQNHAVIHVNEDELSPPCYSQNAANVPHTIMREKVMVKTENRTLSYQEDSLPLMVVESEPVDMNADKPEVIHVTERKIESQVCAPTQNECPLESPYDEKCVCTGHTNSGVEEPGHYFINKNLNTSSILNEKDICITPYNYKQPENAKEKASHSIPSVTLCTQELYPENSTVLWKTGPKPSLLLGNQPATLPMNEQFKNIREEKEKNPSKPVRFTGYFPINAGFKISPASTSRISEKPRCSDTYVRDGTASSLSHHPSNTLTGSLQYSPVPTTSTPKANNKPVCSYYYFSKKNKCNMTGKKQITSKSSAKKPCVPFLFMEKLFPKKNY